MRALAANAARPRRRQLTADNPVLTIARYPCGCRNPLRCQGVIVLKDESYRKWMVAIAAATLIVTIIRLWTGA